MRRQSNGLRQARGKRSGSAPRARSFVSPPAATSTTSVFCHTEKASRAVEWVEHRMSQVRSNREMGRDAMVSDEPSPAIGGNRGRGHPMCVSSTRHASALPGGDGSRLARGGATQAKGRPKASDGAAGPTPLGTAGTDLPIGKCRRVIPWTDCAGPVTWGPIVGIRDQGRPGKERLLRCDNGDG